MKWNNKRAMIAAMKIESSIVFVFYKIVEIKERMPKGVNIRGDVKGTKLSPSLPSF